jgi:hypothetical protein
MNRVIKNGLTILASTSLLVSAATLVMADDATIQGNGVDSENKIEMTDTSETTVVQENKAFIENEVVMEGNSGGNEANENTGSDVGVKTGGVTESALIGNKANSNYASVDACCADGDNSLTIKNNGKDSDNKIKSTSVDSTEVLQGNFALVKNDVEMEGNSGDNEANENTGPAEEDPVEVKTGGVDMSVGIENVANKNVAYVNGCGCEEGDDDHLIKGNGKDSKNKIKSLKATLKLASQGNFAWVGNLVGASGDSGDNEANENTGGSVKVKTGFVSAFVSIFSKLNFNKVSM